MTQEYSSAEIINAVDSRLRKFILSARYRDSDQTIVLYVKSALISKVASSTHTSMRQLENLKKRLGNYKSWKVELVLDLHSRVENFEYVYLELLQEKFPDKIASLSISFLDFGELITNIESKQISNDVRKKIEKYYTRMIYWKKGIKRI